MVWKIFQWGGGRTKAEINKAKLLESAEQLLSSAMEVYKRSRGRIYTDPEHYSPFLKLLQDAEHLLDQAGDANYISEINRIISEINKIISLVENKLRKSIEGSPFTERELGEFTALFEKLSKKIPTDIVNLSSSISEEIQRL